MKLQLFSQQLRENFTLGPVLACGIVFAEISEHVRAKENVMKINLLAKRVIGFVFALSLLLGIGLASSSVARAQWQDPYWRQREQQREQIRRQREWEREQRRRQRQSRDRRYDDRRYDDGYGNYGGSSQLRQTALNAGYNEGIKEGRKDRERGDRFDYRDEEDYRNANTGYNSRLGDRSAYAQYFRQAFVNGYTDGYRGY
jgi:hypothetical protein